MPGIELFAEQQHITPNPGFGCRGWVWDCAINSWTWMFTCWEYLIGSPETMDLVRQRWE